MFCFAEVDNSYNPLTFNMLDKGEYTEIVIFL
jgi:hypothetical protein